MNSAVPQTALEPSETFIYNASGPIAGHDTGYLTIDLNALKRNYRLLAEKVKPAIASAVVKADAYGLGVARVIPALYSAGCRDFFVAQFCEAEAARAFVPEDARLYVLNGLMPGADEKAVALGVIPVLNCFEQFNRYLALAKAKAQRLPAVLQFDTGMSRLGFAPEERAELAARLESVTELEILYCMSHLASADDQQSGQNRHQLAIMKEIAAEFSPIPLCFANSGGIFLGMAYHGSLVRPGIALYGARPFAGAENPVEPVVSLKIAVVQVRHVSKGAAVGYSATYVADGPKRLATLAAGYADGLLRSLSDRGAVYFNGIRLPIVGRVSMDSMTVDVSALPEGALTCGTLVDVIGPDQSVDDVARDAGTISYEILTSLGHRYRRIYVEAKD